VTAGSAGGAPGAASGGLRRVAQGAALIAAITLLARLIGFGRQVVFARAVGPNCVGSTYQTANTVPNILYEIVAGGALASLVVPLLAGAVSAGDRDSVRATASALLTWTVSILVPLAIVVAVLAHPLIALLLGDTRCGGAADLGARMIVVFAPQIVLYGIGVVLTGVLQAHERFAGPALAPLLSSLVVIAAYLLYWADSGASASVAGLGHTAELLLSVGTTIGVVALSLSLLIPLRRAGIRLRPSYHFPPGAARRAARLAAAGVAALVAQQLSVAVALRLANDHTAGGTVVVFTLAQTVFLLPWATLAVPLATSAFPRLAAAVDRGEDDRYARTSGQVSRMVVAVTLVAAAVLIAAAVPIGRVLVQGVGRGGDVTELARGIVAFAPGLVGYGLLALLSRALYARHDARTPAVCTVIGWLVVVVADLVLSAELPSGSRVLALALGNSIGMTVAAILLLGGLWRRAGGAALRGVPRMTAVALIAAAVAGAAGRWLASELAGGGAVAALGQCVVVGVVTLLVAAAALSVLARDDVRRLLRMRRG
jgi:putative peptidoglycan lipid II flippase